MSLTTNLGQRLRLIRAALTRRFIWDDLTAMVKAHGFEFRDIRANTHPLAFARQLAGGSSLPPPPDFRTHIGDPGRFQLANTHAWNSERSVSEFLGELVHTQRAATIVELGCYVGWTSAHLALGQQTAAPTGTLWCLDYNPEFLAAARANLTRLGLASRVEFIQGMSLDPAILARLPSAIDLLFIDTSHAYQPTLDEIATYVSRLSPKGLIALHDSISQEGVRRAILDRWPDFETLTFATEFGNGVTVLRSRSS